MNDFIDRKALAADRPTSGCSPHLCSDGPHLDSCDLSTSDELRSRSTKIHATRRCGGFETMEHAFRPNTRRVNFSCGTNAA